MYYYGFSGGVGGDNYHCMVGDYLCMTLVVQYYVPYLINISFVVLTMRVLQHPDVRVPLL